MKVIAPIAAGCLPKIFELMHHFAAGMLDDFSPHSFGELVEVHRDLLENGISFALVSDEREVLGAVWFDPMGDGMYIGHLVFDPAVAAADKVRFARGCMKAAFARGVRKVSWKLFTDNIAFRNFLSRRLGAQHEGLLRKANRRNGELVDVLLMATFPEDLK